MNFSNFSNELASRQLKQCELLSQLETTLLELQALEENDRRLTRHRICVIAEPATKSTVYTVDDTGYWKSHTEKKRCIEFDTSLTPKTKNCDPVTLSSCIKDTIDIDFEDCSSLIDTLETYDPTSI